MQTLAAWRFYASIHGGIITFMFFCSAFLPLYSIVVKKDVLASKDPTQFQFNCFLYHGQLQGLACDDTEGIQACYDDLSTQLTFCNDNLIQAETVESYTFISMLMLTILIIMTGATFFTAFLFCFDFYELRFYRLPVFRVLAFIHLIACIFGMIVIEQTRNILKETKYANQNGHDQAPEIKFGAIVVALPLSLLALDASMSYKYSDKL